MKYSVDTTGPFRKEARRRMKKYPSLRSKIQELGEKLSENPNLGIPLRNKCYKIRL